MADAATEAAVLKVVKQNILMPVLVAGLLSVLLLGGVLSLSSTYFYKFGTTDRWKWLVIVLTVVSIADTANNCSWLFYTFVEHFGSVEHALLWRHQFTAYLWYTSIVVATVQLWYTWRVFIVSGGNAKIFVGLCVLATLGGAASEMYCAVWVGQNATQLSDFVRIARWCWAYVGTQLLVDFLLSGALVYYLFIRPRKENQGLNIARSGPIQRILTHAVTTNVTSLVLQTAVIALVAYSLHAGSLSYVIPGFLESKVYIGSLFAALNSRERADHGVTQSSHSAFPSRLRGLGSPVASGSVHVRVEREVETDGPNIYDLTEGGIMPYGSTKRTASGRDVIDLEEKAERQY